MQSTTNRSFIIVPGNKHTELINIHSIIRIEAFSNYSKLYLTGGKSLMVAKPLRSFEEKLPSEYFIRIHRTHLVNSNFIRQYSKGSGSTIQLQNGETLEVSRRRKTYFLKELQRMSA